MFNWIMDVLIGKLDKNAFYSGMSNIDRRRVNKRRAHLKRKRDYYNGLFDKALGEFYKDGVLSEIVAKKCPADYQSYKLIYKMYDYALRNEYFSEEKFLMIFFNEYPRNFNINGDHWKKVIRLSAEKDVAVASNLPALFNGRDKIVWDEYLKEKVRGDEIYNEKMKKRISLEATINHFEREVARLNSIFRSMPAGFDRTKVFMSLDATEEQLKQLKGDLANFS